MEYKTTLNLPKTDFPMRAGLPKLEPGILARWQDEDLYGQLLKRGREAKAESFILHDGPPYANGHVHLGTALNKILKDIIVRFHNMMGHFTPYVPGWDCHGMPIEHNVARVLGKAAAETPKLEIRKKCREFAAEFVDVQREEFQRLGCMGDWQNPYITMDYHYEAEIVAALGELVRNGYVYRGKRPIHWCATCQTALAEAELEYHDHNSASIYVKFAVRPGDKKLKALAERMGVELDGAGVLIWTTTPWTIPANLAIALHPESEYVFVRHEGQLLLMADFLRPVVIEALGWESAEVVGEKLLGAELDGMICVHPMFERDSLVLLADYVTLEAGTGCVHTAPGHGADDFETGKKYGLDILSPVDKAGRFTDEVPGYEGKTIFESNGPIVKQLEDDGALLAKARIEHSYPFCWRCKQPLIFRATEQWFLAVDKKDLRKKALAEIERVRWVPHWGEQRIHNMVETRPDWCLSRQRAWGVPIPAVYCTKCGHATLDADVVDKTAEAVRESGTDVWFAEAVERFLPEGFKCPKCGESAFEREEDILDVWFDSSVSQRAVLEHHPDLSWPCDLYLEATDQHRGWFQVSLLTAMGTRGKAPYRQVLTHGLILDEKSKKMSKSLGNVIAPKKIIDEYGADVLRLLFSSVDYTADISFTKGMLKPLSDAYRKMRNTLRFLLGNLGDFDPTTQRVDEAEMSEIDRWLRARMRQVGARVHKAYLDYEFHTVYHQLLELCTVDLSALYMDSVKDRLYAEARDDKLRRSCQSAMYDTALDFLAMVAPILSFTAEEVWGYLPADPARPASVHVSLLPKTDAKDGDEALLARWARMRTLRGEVNKAVEAARNAGILKSSLDGKATLVCDQDSWDFLQSFDGTLLDVLKLASLARADSLGEGALVSDVLEGLRVMVEPSTDEKCKRCWNRRPEVGKIASNPDICTRCVAIMEQRQT